MTQQLNLRVFGDVSPKIVMVPRKTQNVVALQAALRIISACTRTSRRDVRSQLDESNVAELNSIARRLEILMATARGTGKRAMAAVAQGGAS